MKTKKLSSAQIAVCQAIVCGQILSTDNKKYWLQYASGRVVRGVRPQTVDALRKMGGLVRVSWYFELAPQWTEVFTEPNLATGETLSSLSEGDCDKI